MIARSGRAIRVLRALKPSMAMIPSPKLTPVCLHLSSLLLRIRSKASVLQTSVMGSKLRTRANSRLKVKFWRMRVARLTKAVIAPISSLLQLASVRLIKAITPPISSASQARGIPTKAPILPMESFGPKRKGIRVRERNLGITKDLRFWKIQPMMPWSAGCELLRRDATMSPEAATGCKNLPSLMGTATRPLSTCRY